MAKFAVEFIRRYPTAEGLFLSAFTDTLKYVSSTKEEEISRVKKPVVLMFCELCLCGTVAKENVVGKLIKSIADAVSASVPAFSVFHSRPSAKPTARSSSPSPSSTATSTWACILPSSPPS